MRSTVLASDSVTNHQISNNIINFLGNNVGQFLDHLSVVSMDRNDKEINSVLRHLLNARKFSSYNQLHHAIYKSIHFGNSSKKASHIIETFSRNFVAIASAANSSKWQLYLDLMSGSNPNNAILGFTESFDINRENALHQRVKNLSMNSMFYMTYFIDGEFRWYRVITLTNYDKAVINLLEFDLCGKLIEGYDMQGLHIVSVTLSWSPYFTLECDEKAYTNCQGEGYLADAMDILGDMMNFTWESHAQKEGDWGVKPISGPVNSSGVWGGVVGDVFKGAYQFSIRYTLLLVNLSHNAIHISRYIFNFENLSLTTYLLMKN